MASYFERAIEDALGQDLAPDVGVRILNDAEWPSSFAVSDLAQASISAAAQELGDLKSADDVTVDRRLSSLWFDMTLRPQNWEMPSAWDAIAGVYQTQDGWIRLHTNAPHHRDAALRVLNCKADKDTVAAAVGTWTKTELETAIVDAHGTAAAMHSLDDWAAHPQGMAVAAEPLIDWQTKGEGAPPVSLTSLKVLDLTRVLAGPVATRFLAGFGANVLRIDPPSWSEPGVEPEVTIGKRCAGLDLTKSEDRTCLENLVKDADLLVHGYRPGALAGLGFGPDRLKELAPHMIEISLCAYGWTGPWSDRRGFDSLVQMSCGIAHEGMKRKRAGHPVPLPVQALDHATGYLMAAAALRALRVRNHSGQISRARLSLARTAALLVDAGPRGFEGAHIEKRDADFNPVSETTSWGAAQRVRFPVEVDGQPPNWAYPAGFLRRHPAIWLT